MFVPEIELSAHERRVLAAVPEASAQDLAVIRDHTIRAPASARFAFIHCCRRVTRCRPARLEDRQDSTHWAVVPGSAPRRPTPSAATATLRVHNSAIYSMNDDLQAFRKTLPVFQRRADVLGMVAQSQVSLLSSSTGSGKTTQARQRTTHAFLTGAGAAVHPRGLCGAVCCCGCGVY